MKIRLQAIFFALFGLYAASAQTGGEYFIMYSPTCMDRLEYAYSFTPADQHYVKYQIKVNPTEALVLGVGPEAASPVQTYLSAPTISCGATDVFTRDLVNKIRNNQVQVYMVRPVQGNRYQVTKVNDASYFRRDSRGVVYDSWQFSVDHLGGLKVGERITRDNASGVNVTFEGPTRYQCADAYLFRQTYTFDPNAYMEMFFVPTLGIVEERSSRGRENSFFLKAVNETPIDTYLQRLCASGISATPDFLPGGGTLVGGQSPASSTDVMGGGTAFHTVERGETLYSISRQYGVTVDQLKSWNGMGNSTMLRTGDQLRVRADAMATSAPATTTTTGYPAYAGGGAPAATGSTYIPPRQETLTARGRSRDTRFAWNTTTGTHIVQPGETVALLALKYGYTEARFRDMNGLGVNDVLKVGQTLNTIDCPETGGYGITTPPAGATSATTYPSGLGGTATTSYPSYPTPDQPSAATTAPRSGTAFTGSGFEPYQTGNYQLGALSGDFSTRGAPATGATTSGQLNFNNTDYSPYPGATGQPATTTGAGTFAPTSSSSGTFGTPLTGAGAPATSAYPATTTGAPPARNYDFNYGGTTTQPATTTSRTTTSGAYRAVHTVREGETLESIARKYGASADYLRQINNMDRNEVLIPYKTIYIN